MNRQYIRAQKRHARPAHGAGATFQGGVTLVMSMLFLLLLTILGITALNTNTLQEKMAGNARDSDMAMQAAESALRGGEQAVNQLYVTYPLPVGPVPDGTGSQGVWSTGSTFTGTDSWWYPNSIQYSAVSGLAASPRYVVEYAGFARDNLLVGAPASGFDYYRITSRARGLTQSSQVMLESTYRVHRP